MSALRRLFGAAYFGEDWRVIYGSTTRVLEQFVRWHPEEASTLGEEVDALLAATPDDDLADELDRLGCGYLPSAEGLTCRQWLEALVAKTRGMLAAAQPPPSHLPELDPVGTRDRWLEWRRTSGA